MKKHIEDIEQQKLIKSTKDLGQFVRAYRKSKGITLETISGLSNVSTKFLSEFERGKETAEIGKILKVLNALGLELSIEPRKSKLHRVTKTFTAKYDIS
ncbi:MAG: hypothetical protein A2993_01385 [Gammaproteobacteria bacterium RIFCSPLOWO2_01_FULL_47_190]|nr:MAG: hypothetical protein A2993_01385 [Gammaproteobacteria bacterium RIFCSPLOWO2_01_FULL_47_190]